MVAMTLNIQQLFDNFREKLTILGRAKVFDEGKELDSAFMKITAKPEAVTITELIDPIITYLKLTKLPQKNFTDTDGNRWVDYYLKNQKGDLFLLEAKPINQPLDKKGDKNAGVNQIKRLFRLAEVRDVYTFGIATDGRKWIFIDKTSKVVYPLDITNDFVKITEILVGNEEVSSEKIEEEISKKFYEWYRALIYGGNYRGGRVSTSDCLTKNIIFVSTPDDAERIAQTIIDRLIFIKFLQSKGIIHEDVLNYLATLDETRLNAELKQLFFDVLNTEKSRRSDVNPEFQGIPYLNGSLFIRTDAEIKNPDYKIRARILGDVIKFLKSFKFVHKEGFVTEDTLDPEILGYIFEKAMTDADRKGTGAYYTPKMVTQYISENTIHNKIVEWVNINSGRRRTIKPLRRMDEVYSLDKDSLKDVLNKVLVQLRICDNACGSGAFLLSAANVLLEAYETINDKLQLGLSEIEIKKTILKNNIYGVDLNPNAIEIAKLRLWLWLVISYEPQLIEPLPNIEYNVRVGNSLIGFIDINKFKEQKLNLSDWMDEGGDNSLKLLIIKREGLLREYKGSSGDLAKKLKCSLEDIDRRVRKLLDLRLYQEINAKVRISQEDFAKLKPFHWGFEFAHIFNSNGVGGFDVINGNPPYGNILTGPEKKAIYDFETCNVGEIAANFIERSLQIATKNGHIGLIVANSIAINASTHKARELIRKHMAFSMMALFGTRPAKIFADAEIRVLIFLGEKNDPEQEGVIFTTEAIKFTRDRRSSLLDHLEFESTDGLILGKGSIGDNLEDTGLPKVGNPAIRSILLELKNKSGLTVKDRINKYGFKEALQFRKTGGYWLNALEKMPYKSTKIETIKFETALERDLGILLINSSLFYLYWSTYSNLRDFPPSLLDKFPFPEFELLRKYKKRIDSLTKELSICLKGAFIKDRGRVGEFRTARCKTVIDKVDELLGEIYDLNKKQVQFVKKYDTHIRKM